MDHKQVIRSYCNINAKIEHNAYIILQYIK